MARGLQAYWQKLPWQFVQSRWALGNPEPWLRWLAGKSDWLFHQLAIPLWLAFFAVSLTLVTSRLLVTPTPWLALGNSTSSWVAFLCVIFATRIAHELGHAIVCLRAGAHCREWGLMWMMGVACPYVDVTDSWRLYEPRSRMAVAAAGIYVELVLASIAGIIWFASREGLVHQLAYQIMLTCSLMTILVNANPLMRYDGYYLLSDYLDATNLREQASRATRDVLHRLGSWPWRRSPQARPVSDPPTLVLGLLVFHLAAWLYRGSLIVAVLWAVFAITHRWQLPALGYLFAILVGFSMVGLPLLTILLNQLTATSVSWHAKGLRLTAGLVVAAIVACLSFVPIPHRIACRGQLQPHDGTVIYAQAAGCLQAALDWNQYQLENHEVRDRWLQAQRTHAELQGRLHQIRQAAYLQPTMLGKLPTLQMLTQLAWDRSQQTYQELARLRHLGQPGESWIPLNLPPLLDPGTDLELEETGTIFDEANRRRWLARGTPIAVATRSDRVLVETELPLEKIEGIEIGTAARVCLDQQATRFYQARVIRISHLTTSSSLPQSDRPPLLASQPPGMATDREAKPIAMTLIQLQLENASLDELALFGNASIVFWAEPQTLYSYARHQVAATFGPIDWQPSVR
jgi:putative peptide zinc metalloprotease protein